MKSYTDLKQSKKLVKILPLESADMCYRIVAYNPDDTHVYQPYCFIGTLGSDVPCWSLAALLGVLPKIDNYRLEIRHIDNNYCCCYTERNNVGDLYWYYADNPVDACYEIIIKLHELNLL